MKLDLIQMKRDLDPGAHSAIITKEQYGEIIDEIMFGRLHGSRFTINYSDGYDVPDVNGYVARNIVPGFEFQTSLGELRVICLELGEREPAFVPVEHDKKCYEFWK